MWCAEKSSSNYRKYNSGRNALIAGGHCVCGLL